jgi:hypothetical protein
MLSNTYKRAPCFKKTSEHYQYTKQRDLTCIEIVISKNVSQNCVLVRNFKQILNNKTEAKYNILRHRNQKAFWSRCESS